MFARRGLTFFISATPRTTGVVVMRRGVAIISYFARRLLSEEQHGNTPLHQAIYASQPLAEINRLIESVGRDAVSRMARTVNHRGFLPLDLVRDKDTPDSDTQKIGLALLPLMQVDIPPLSQPISPLILQRYKAITPNNIKLQTELAIAYTLANQARQIVTKSATHPQSNDYSLQQVSEIQGSIEAVDKRIRERLAASHTTADLLISPTVTDDIVCYLRCSVQYTAESGRGNCDQISHLVVYQFAINFFEQAQKLGIKCILQGITNGGHVFVRIGDVICDAWSGDIFPVSEIAQRLKGWKYYTIADRWHNVLVEFNPHYHKIRNCIIVTPSIAHVLSSNPLQLFPPSPPHNDSDFPVDMMLRTRNSLA